MRKLNTLFRTLEEQSQFLSRDGSSAPDSGKIYALCEILLEDLNNYSEAMIPIDASNTLNIKLFPTYPPPPPLYAHHVPLATVRLEDLVDENWDLTMLRVLPWIDGVNSVKQIALLADADLKLVRKAIRHLLYYGCVLLLDIFSFGAIYAPTAEIPAFVESKEMQAECARYVTLQQSEADKSGSAAAAKEEEELLKKKKKMNDNLSGTQLAELYLSLRQGLSVKSWCAEHADVVGKMDIRRFVTFGVIKGFLYRVHKYAYATTTTTTTSSSISTANHRSNSPSSYSSSKKKKNEKMSRANLYRAEMHKRKQKQTKHQNDDDGDHEVHVHGDAEQQSEPPDLARYLDGTHCFDEMCTDLMVSEKELTARLKAWGDVQIICR